MPMTFKEAAEYLKRQNPEYSDQSAKVFALGYRDAAEGFGYTEDIFALGYRPFYFDGWRHFCRENGEV